MRELVKYEVSKNLQKQIKGLKKSVNELKEIYLSDLEKNDYKESSDINATYSCILEKMRYIYECEVELMDIELQRLF